MQKKIDFLKVLGAGPKKYMLNTLDFAVYYGNLKGFQLVCTTILNDLEIRDWSSFERSQLFKQHFNPESFERWIKMCKDFQCVALNSFLESLEINALNKKNFRQLIGMLNYENELNVTQREINKAFDEYKKEECVANTLLKYIKNKETMNDLNEAINKMVENKEPISDLLLIIAGKLDQNKLSKTLEKSVKQSIKTQDSDKNSENNENNGMTTKARDYLWYQNDLLHSKIWAMKDEIDVKAQAESHAESKQANDDRSAIDEKKQEGTNNKLLFDRIERNVIEKELGKQHLLIKESIDKWSKEELNNVMNLKELIVSRNLVTRQDVLFSVHLGGRHLMREKGTKIGFHEKSLVFNFETGFNGINESDYNIYLTKLLCNSEIVNPDFQKECLSLFGDNIYHRAPIKKKIDV